MVLRINASFWFVLFIICHCHVVDFGNVIKFVFLMAGAKSRSCLLSFFGWRIDDWVSQRVIHWARVQKLLFLVIIFHRFKLPWTHLGIYLLLKLFKRHIGILSHDLHLFHHQRHLVRIETSTFDAWYFVLTVSRFVTQIMVTPFRFIKCGAIIFRHRLDIRYSIR